MTSASTTVEVRVGCEFSYCCEGPSPAIVLVRPQGVDAEILEERWERLPEVPRQEYADGEGNRRLRLTLPAGASTLRYHARVAVPPDPAATDWAARKLALEELPNDVLPYLLPSRFCLSDALAARAWKLFGDLPPSWACVQAICDWVHEHVRFRYGASGPLTTAVDVYESGSGVCRDFAHLAVTFCRALNIPARYAFGYLPDIGVPPPDAPMDFCAWFEAYLGDRWWTFDPRNNQRRIGHILIGRGRDAIDVPMMMTYGDAELRAMTVWADPIG